jgi:hypothetical protein
MTDDPQSQQFRQVAQAAREDEAAVDQLHGAMETLNEKVADDPVVAATLASCVKFRLLVKELLRALDGSSPLTPAATQALVDEWQAARAPFHDARRKNRDYLEKLALRVYR